MNPRHEVDVKSKFKPKIFSKVNQEGTLQWFIRFEIKHDEEFGPYNSEAEAEAEKALPDVRGQLQEVIENVMIKAGQEYR
ncbi:MAG: hypothetical protein NPIRA02_26810 [Nitrospirales bacterium]|nr:MAG: hypothetical protein NPIRA02_26810 [Nitrospirales bacterium]